MPRTIILFGDSIFDNGAYVNQGEPDVAAQLREKLSDRDWLVDVRAVDGHLTADVSTQVIKTPIPRPCVMVLSAGGNDALGHASLLTDETQRTFGETMLLLHEVKERFRRNYASTLNLLGQHDGPLVACTIYNGNFPEADVSKATQTALSVFNDVIVEEALRRRLDIIDLRQICDCPEDYANPIEPSAVGGAKIAEAIFRAVAAPVA